MLAALGAASMLSADVGQRHRQIDPQPAPRLNESKPETKNETPAAPRHTGRIGTNDDSNGYVVSSKTGARARVGVRYAARFQAYIDDLENNHGARVLFMGGIRPGRCSLSSEHPCGKALDVCQLRRGAVDRRCKLPGRVALGRIAASHGLFEGGRWCDSDYGHAQVDFTAAACGNRPFRAHRQMKPPSAEQAKVAPGTLAAR